MSEKMRWSEAESIVRAYRAEHGAAAGVDVARLAEALGTDVAEIRRLANPRRRFTDRSGVLSAGIAMAFACGAALFLGTRALTYRPIAVAPPAPQAALYRHRSTTMPKIEIHSGTGWIQIDGNPEKIALGDLSKTNDGRLYFQDDEPL